MIGSHRWRHWGDAISVAFRSDGKLIASGGNDCFVRLWDPLGNERAALELPSTVSMVNAVAFRPDGQVVLAGGEDGVIYAWDVSEAEPKALTPIHPSTRTETNPIGMLAGASSIDAIEFTPDGKWLACSMGRQSRVRIVLWDATRWPPVERPELPQATGPFAFSADGKSLVTQEDSGNILVWDLTGERPKKTASGQLPRPRGQMLTMAIAPDSKSLVTCHGDSDSLLGVMPGDPEGSVILWDLNVTPPKPTAVFGAFKYDPMYWMTRSAAFSRDGKLLVFAARQNRAELWDMTLQPPKKVSELSGYVGQSGTVAFAPDDQTLASVGTGVVLWDLNIAPPDLRSPSSPLARSEFLSPDGWRLAKEEPSGSWPNTTTCIWDLSRPVPTPISEIRSGKPLGFGADGMLVTVDHAAVQAIPESAEEVENAPSSFPSSLGRWDVSGAMPRHAGTISLPSLSDFTPRPIAFGAGVQTSLSSVFPGENRNGELVLLRLIDHRDAKFCKLPIPRESELYPSAVSAKGAVFAAAIGEYGNRIIKVWDITGDEAQERASIQPAKIPTRDQGTLPDGRGFDAGPGELRPFNVWGLALASDGGTIALSDADGNIQIWSVAGAEPKLLATLSGHQQERVMGAVRDLKFSSDAQRLLTVGGDRKLIVWDIASAQALYTAVFPDASMMAAEFAPDQRHVITSNPDGTLYVLRLPQRP